MSSATERAEARRKAILAKRGDRLAKLTTSARGEESVYLGSDDASLRSKDIGSPGMTTPSRISVSPSPGPTISKSTSTSSPSAPLPPTKPETHHSIVDDSVWSPELQERFHRALANADSPSSKYSSGESSGEFALGKGHNSRSDGQADADPITEMLASLSDGTSSASSSDMFSLLHQVRQGTQASGPEVDALQRQKEIRRIVQLVTAWLLLACFVFLFEPSAYRARVGSLDVGRWTRWAVLGEDRNMLELLQTFIVQPQPSFFWTFVALEIFLHFDSFRHVLPIRSDRLHQDVLGLIKRLLGIFNIVMSFLNDLGSIIFGLGLVVFFAGYVTPK